uniref:Uncharacterized protein n=1 Tax=Ananas comosus var. bracteatus TaxID=296719 RepID=A0A6V7PM84_ANACO|nr:unnamed protein product [Ananas comosus var. bracteatus]
MFWRSGGFFGYRASEIAASAVLCAAREIGDSSPGCDGDELARSLAQWVSKPSEIATAADAARAERRAARVTAALDRRDVPGCDNSLHLAARLPRAPTLAAALAVVGADPSLQNAAGWTPLGEVGSCHNRLHPAIRNEWLTKLVTFGISIEVAILQSFWEGKMEGRKGCLTFPPENSNPWILSPLL